MATSTLSIATPPDQTYEALRQKLPQSGIQVQDSVPNAGLHVRIPVKTKIFKFSGFADGQIKLIPQGTATTADLTATVSVGTTLVENCLDALIAGTCWAAVPFVPDPVTTILSVLGLIFFVGAVFHNGVMLPKDALTDLEKAVTAASAGGAVRAIPPSVPQPPAASSPVNAPQPGVPPATHSATDQNVALLTQLADLHAKGILTTEEFESKKKEILRKIAL
jgi:hypothetical protein